MYSSRSNCARPRTLGGPAAGSTALRSIATLTCALALAFVARPAAWAGDGHVIAEAGAGVMHGLSDPGSTAPGHATSLLLGVGGRPGGSLLRYFFIVEGVTGRYTRTHDQNFRSISLQRRVFDLGAGIRIVAPLFTSRFRVFLDSEVVLMGSDSTFVGELIADDDSWGLNGGVRVAAGFQFRPLQLLSVGGRLALTTAFDELDDGSGRGWLVGFDAEAGHFESTAAVTLYF